MDSTDNHYQAATNEHIKKDKKLSKNKKTNKQNKTKQNKTKPKQTHHSRYHTGHKIEVRLTAKEEKLENKSIQCNMFSLTIVMIIT